MANHQTKISGYTVDVTTGYADDSGTNGCWINYGSFSASLAALEDTGCLENIHTGNLHRVDSRVIEAIREWSESKGY